MTFFGTSAYGDESAAWYDDFISDELPTDTTVAVLKDLLPETGLVAEIGAGSGRVALPLAAIRPSPLLGTDISPDMVERIHQSRLENVSGLVHDIVGSPLPNQVAGAYAIFNTLFMLGPVPDQDQALSHLRARVPERAPLVLEFFQVQPGMFGDDALTISPQVVSERGVLLAVSDHDEKTRRVNTQSIAITARGFSIAPSSFHYRTANEVDVAAHAAGWRLRDRWASWDRRSFVASAPNCITWYEAI